MKLVDEIIELASDGTKPLADALRKCLILAFELKNEALKEWTEKELNGFYKDDPVPKYREAILHSKGNLTSIGGARMTDRPLPLTVLDREHWDLLTHRLVQPIAAYESFVTSGQNENPSIPWPPDLIAHYQVVTAPLRRRSWAVPAVLALAQLAVTAAMVAYGISVERRVARMIQEAGCEPAASQPPRDLIRRASR